ncbi:MAG: 5,6-dimethylbenzimidazole synthase [Gordonia sp. (in: high G+C Gram-positive bacteria)]
MGDQSSARERAADPSGWAFSADERAVLYRLVNARRDVRRFRPDPIAPELLERVLTAGHCAPSVGHSQPWRFIVVTDAATRERAALLADRARQLEAAAMTPESARGLLDLQLDGIREAPLGVVVCCDRRTPAAGVLGRATFPDADLWSCACAIENMWLAARAEGLGMGWVTLFEPAELAELVGLPDGVVSLGWLCLGWPDERPPEPGLARAGWSRRLTLDEVVLTGRWGSDAPAPPPSHARAPDQRSVVATHDDADELLRPPQALGVLDGVLDRLLALRHPRPDRGRLILAVADHPVTRHHISPYEPTVTAEVGRAAVAGEASGVVAARASGLEVTIIDAGCHQPLRGAHPIRPAYPRGDLVDHRALDPRDVSALMRAGRAVGHAAAEVGAVVLGEVGVGNTTVAAALTAAVLGLSAQQVVGRGAGADSAMIDRKRSVVECALRRASTADLTDAATLLAELGGGEFAVLTGTVLGAAERGAPIILDGLATTVCAAIAVRIDAGVAAHLIAGQRSREPAHAALLTHLGLEPVLDLRLRAGEGIGAALAFTVIQHGVRVRRETARTARQYGVNHITPDRIG